MTHSDRQTVISPEHTAKKRSDAPLLMKVLRYYAWPISSRIDRLMAQRRWSHHADPRSLDWNWDAVNYNRAAVVNLLLNRFTDPSYLEIGCASNSLFNAVPVTRKTGVDPSSGGTVRTTSDEFFTSNMEKFDVVFIDGMHEYEQVRRDVINSMRAINHRGWIALHDMLPRNWVEHHVPIVSQGSWTGNVWKVAFELAKTEGIEFKIIKIDHGVGVIRVLDPGTELKDFRGLLSDKEFDFYYDHLAELPIVEWDEARDWISS